METFDVGIIGSGVAGSFAVYKIAKDYPSLKVLLIEVGRPPLNRHQLDGFLGCLPNSNGKLYASDLDNLQNSFNQDDIDKGFSYVKRYLKDISDLKVIKDRAPNTSFLKR